MSPMYQIVFGFLGLIGVSLGVLMVFVPSRYPKLYAAFLNEKVLQRERDEQARIVAIRVHGLIAVTVGAFFMLFVWALR